MILQWLAAPEWTRLVEALLHTLWQGALFAVVLGQILRRSHDPVWRYRSSLAALAAILLAGLITWAALMPPAAARHLPVATAAASPPAVAAAPPVAPAAAAAEQPPLVVQFTLPAAEVTGPNWTAWLAFIWLAGAAGMLTRATLQVAGAERLRRSCRPLTDPRVTGLFAEAQRALGLARRVRLAVTDQLTSPAVTGVLIPTLILPLSLTTTLSPDQIRMVLLHELAHIRRGDYFANLFQLLAEALLFFNPAVWWISRQIRVEREACCDATAIALSGAPAEYAQTLLCVAESLLQPPPAAAPGFGGPRHASLLDRIQRMLVPGYRPALRLTWRAMLLAMLTGGGLLILCALGTQATLAAILSPQERIARIEKKMAENGQNPDRPVDFNENNDPLPKVSVSGQVQTADGTPLPEWVWVNWVSLRDRSSYGSSEPARNGSFSNGFVMPAGTFWFFVDLEGYAPSSVGPLDGFATNRLADVHFTLNRGFDLPLQLIDADTGLPVTNARATTLFWMENHSFQTHSWKTGTNGSITLTHCADFPMTLTVNAPGYEIYQNRFAHIRAGEPLRVSLRRGAILAGVVLDKLTGQPIPGAEWHLLYQKDSSVFSWDDPVHSLGRTDDHGTFAINQLRENTPYYLGLSASGHESTVLQKITAGTQSLVVRVGPEVVIHGRVLGNLDKLYQYGEDKVLSHLIVDSFEGSQNSSSEWVPVTVQSGVARFTFTNRLAGVVTLTAGSRTFERTVTGPVDDWVIDLTPLSVTNPPVLKRTVVFRFRDAAGNSPQGTVTVNIPDNLDPDHLTAHDAELIITNGQVQAEIPVGGWTQCSPKRTVGYWFSSWSCHTNVSNGPGPLILDVPVVPAGALYARAQNADGTPAEGLFFSVEEVKRSPQSPDDFHLPNNDGVNYPSTGLHRWVSGPLPLGGTYRVIGSRGNSFCASPPIKLTEAQPDAEVVLKFPPGQSFTGVVLDTNGQPVSNTSVGVSFVTGENNFGLNGVLTDEHGRFQVDDTTPGLGTYSVSVSVPGCQAGSQDVNFSRLPVKFQLKPGHKLAGQVVEAATGYVIPQVEVRVWSENPKLPSQQVQTDDNGRFEFNTLGDDTYHIFVDGVNFGMNYKREYPVGQTNLLLRVTPNAGSSLHPRPPVTAAATPNATSPVSTNGNGIITNPAFTAALQALQKQTNVENLKEPTVTVDTGHGIKRAPRTATSPPPGKKEAQNFVQDGKVLYEMGKLDEAEKALKEALLLNPTNAAAQYYLNLVHQARDHKLPLQHNLPDHFSSLDGGFTFEEMEHFHLASFGPFDQRPLAEVLKELTAEVRRQNTDKPGFPIEMDNTDELTNDIHSVLVTVKYPFTNITLAVALGIIVLDASQPINFFESNGKVVFRPVPPNTLFLTTRTFKIDPACFELGLKQLGIDAESAEPADSTPVPTGGTNGIDWISKIGKSTSATARQLFKLLGVDLTYPKSVFFNERLGLLMVRATEADLDKVEKVLQAINLTLPQIHIKARFVEVPAQGFIVPPLHPIGGTNLTAGILTRDETKAFLQSLRTNSVAETLAEPEATSASGRQVMMKATSIISVVPGATMSTNGMVPHTEQLEIGPVLNATPHVLADGYTVFLNAKAQFYGYRKLTAPEMAGATNHSAFAVTPVIRDLQAEETANLWDGQTLVVGQVGDWETRTTRDKVPVLGDIPLISRLFTSQSTQTVQNKVLILVTAEIVDPAGNRIHSDDELPFAKDAVPDQPLPKPGDPGQDSPTYPQPPAAPTAVSNETTTATTGILTNPAFTAALQALKKQTGIETLPEPEVTTVSGHSVNQIPASAISSSPDKRKAQALVQDGNLFYEMGMLDRAEKALNAALALDPANPAPQYYLSLIDQARAKLQSSQTHVGSLPVAQKPGHWPPAAAAIGLQNIQIATFGPFHEKPLADVLIELQANARQADRQGHSIILAMESARRPASPIAQQKYVFDLLDPVTGLLTNTADPTQSATPDKHSVTITIETPLQNVSLLTAVAAILSGASQPVHYSVTEAGAVLFAPDPMESWNMTTRIFKIDPAIFSGQIKQLGPEGSVTWTNHQEEVMTDENILLAAKQLFRSNGLDLEAPKTMFYNHNLSLLMVRATEADLDKIERVLMSADVVPPPVHRQAQLREWMASTSNVASSAATGISTNPAYTAAHYAFQGVQTPAKPSAGQPATENLVASLFRIRLAHFGPFPKASLDNVVRELNRTMHENGLPDIGFDPALRPDSVLIQMPAPLENARLADVLTGLVNAADTTATYAVQNDRVVISGKNGSGLAIRLFRFNQNTIVADLQKRTGLATGSVPALTLALFNQLGLDWQALPGKQLIYNDKAGILYVQASPTDLDTIEQAVRSLNSLPPQIHLRSKIFTVPENLAAAFAKATGLTNGATTVLTVPRTKALLAGLQTIPGLQLLAEPEGVTVSRREIQMRESQVVTVVTNFAYLDNTTNTSAIFPQASRMEFGPVLDVLPVVSPDGTQIDLTATATDDKFFGYTGAHRNFLGLSIPPTRRITNSSGEKIEIPEVVDVRQSNHATAQATLADGQTLVLFPKPEAESDPRRARLIARTEKKNGKRFLVVLVSVEMVDPTGNRIHPDQVLAADNSVLLER